MVLTQLQFAFQYSEKRQEIRRPPPPWAIRTLSKRTRASVPHTRAWAEANGLTGGAE